MVAGELKVATVESVESIDNMATLPVSQRQHGGSDVTPEKNNSANKEMEAKKEKKHAKDKEKGKDPKDLKDPKDPNQPKRYEFGRVCTSTGCPGV